MKNKKPPKSILNELQQEHLAWLLKSVDTDQAKSDWESYEEMLKDSAKRKSPYKKGGSRRCQS